MKQSQPNPDYQELSLNKQRDYISRAKDTYFGYLRKEMKTSHNKGYISWYYHIGRFWGVLEIDYKEFENYFLNDRRIDPYSGHNYYNAKPINIPETEEERWERLKKNKYWNQRWCRRKDTWYESHGVGYRERQSFQRKPHHVKKEKEESPRDIWWRKKNFLKDKAKSYRQRSLPRASKDRSHRTERAWARKEIYKEDWDNFQNHKDYLHYDPWDWY